jgi:NTE family protein
LIKNYIATIRTDLDSFSEAEAAVLENHGYWLADTAIQKHVHALMPATVPALNVPHPEWAGSEDKIREALKDSSKRTLLGHAHGVGV